MLRKIENAIVHWMFPVLIIFVYSIICRLLGAEIPDYIIVFSVIIYIILIYRFYNWFFKEYSGRTFDDLTQNPDDIFNQSSVAIKMKCLEKNLTELSKKDDFIKKFNTKIKNTPKFNKVFGLFNSNKKEIFMNNDVYRLMYVHNIVSFYFIPTILRLTTSSYNYFADNMATTTVDKLTKFNFITIITLLNSAFILGKSLVPFTLAMVAHDIIKFIIVLARENYEPLKIYLKIYDKMLSDFEYKKQLDFIDKRAYYQLDIDDEMHKKFL